MDLHRRPIQMFYQWSEGSVPNSTYNKLRSDYIDYPAGPAGMPEQGMPPGNYKGVAPQRRYPSYRVYRLCVRRHRWCRIPRHCKRISTFSSWGTVVEAARGNMESSTILKQACLWDNPVYHYRSAWTRLLQCLLDFCAQQRNAHGWSANGSIQLL